jgi:hypothetical protein
VTCVIRVWRERPPRQQPAERTGGRPRRPVRLAPGAPPAETVAEVVASRPRRQWRRLRVGAGAKGPRRYDWVRVQVIESRDDLPGPAVWLLARRSVSRPEEVADYLAVGPRTSSLHQLPAPAGPGGQYALHGRAV